MIKSDRIFRSFGPEKWTGFVVWGHVSLRKIVLDNLQPLIEMSHHSRKSGSCSSREAAKGQRAKVIGCREIRVISESSVEMIHSSNPTMHCDIMSTNLP